MVCRFVGNNNYSTMIASSLVSRWKQRWQRISKIPMKSNATFLLVIWFVHWQHGRRISSRNRYISFHRWIQPSMRELLQSCHPKRILLFGPPSWNRCSISLPCWSMKYLLWLCITKQHPKRAHHYIHSMTWKFNAIDRNLSYTKGRDDFFPFFVINRTLSDNNGNNYL